MSAEEMNDLGDVIPEQIADDTKKLELAKLVSQLLQHPDKPRVQNLLAARIYTLGARHMLEHMTSALQEADRG